MNLAYKIQHFISERQVSSYLTLATQTLSTFNYLTQNIKKPFLKPEVADRLTAMLNINLKQLCSKDRMQLKVDNKEKYGWKPQSLLKSLADLYLHLQCPEFIDFLAREERSYSPDLFKTALDTMEKVGVIDEEGSRQWKAMSAKVETKVNIICSIEKSGVLIIFTSGTNFNKTMKTLMIFQMNFWIQSWAH